MAFEQQIVFGKGVAMDDVIKLIAMTYEAHEAGNQIPVPVERSVFCDVRSIGRSEFYSAAQTDLHPEYTFRISHFKDYQGERAVKYTDWTGQERTFIVIRTYRVPESDAVELTVEERAGDGGL